MSEIDFPRADRSLFSLHERDPIFDRTRDHRQLEYLETNLRIEFCDRFVGGNLGVATVPGYPEDPCFGADILVSREPLTSSEPDVYVVWEHGPIQFIVDVASERNHPDDRRRREITYRDQLQLPEYLYVDLNQNELALWRLHAGEYHRVPEEDGRLHSQELNAWCRRPSWPPLKQMIMKSTVYWLASFLNACVQNPKASSHWLVQDQTTCSGP